MSSLGPSPPVGAHEERRWATVLFADLAGFTALAEHLDPEEVKELAQSFVVKCGAAVTRFGGVVIREIGDEVLVVFGAPLAHEDDAERAVRAALAMRDLALRDGAGKQLQVHIGVNTGEVLAGLVGGAERRDYTVHGDAVNTAARLRSAAAPGSVLVGEETYRATRRVVRYAGVRAVEAKGKERPVVAWEALEVAPLPEARPLGAAPLIGRDRELGLLSELWAKVQREARPHLVTIVGEAGIGKSRLVAEFKRRTLHEARVLHGRCLPYGEVLGYWALAMALKDAAGVTAEDEPGQARARLGALVEDVLAQDGAVEEADVVARHLALLSGWIQDLAADRIEEVSAQHVLHASARRFLEALARQQPVCLLLEDLHWADGALLDLVEFVASHAVDAPLMIVAQARPELLEKRPTWGRGVRGFASLALEPLAGDEAAELVVALCRARGLAPSVAEQVSHAAGGNPLFAEELVATVAERGALAAIPSAIKTLISARLDPLPAAERQTLQLAAVCGKLFWEGALRALGAAGDIGAQLEALEQRNLIRAQTRSHFRGDRQYAFKHDLIRDVAYETLPRAVRRVLHGRLTDWLEQTSGERVDEYLDVLAHHAVQADQPERGLDYLVRAAERARCAAALREQATLLGQALAITERLGERELAAELHADRGRAFFRTGVWVEARAELEAALAGLPPERRDRRCEVLLDLALVCTWLMDVPSTRRHAREALELAEQLGRQDLTAGAIGALALAESSDGNTRGSLVLYRRALGGPRVMRSEVVGPVLDQSGLVLHWLGRSTAALQRGHEAAEVAQAAHDTATLVRARGNIGMVLTAMGRYAEALQTFEEAERVAREDGLPTWLARTIAIRGGLHLDLFDFAGAEALAAEAREHARSVQFPLPVASAGIDLLFNFARRGEPGQADRLVTEVGEAVQSAQGVHGWLWRMRYAQARAELALAQADWDAALRWAADGIVQSRARGRKKYLCLGIQTCALALAAKGRQREAIAQLRRAVRLARNVDEPALFVQTAGALLALDGDDADLAREARSTVERMLRSLPDGDLRQRLMVAEPVRRLLAPNGDRFEILAGHDDRRVT